MRIRPGGRPGLQMRWGSNEGVACSPDPSHIRSATVGIWLDASTRKYPESFLLVDRDEYLSRLRFNKWTMDQTGYAVGNVDGKRTSLHRYVMRAEKGEIVDHVNGDKLDNRRCNLRIVTARQNRWNSPGRKGSSRFTGVCWDTGKGIWKAQINANGRFQHLGYFEDEKDAARAYNTAARQAYGEFARLNVL